MLTLKEIQANQMN